MIADLQMLLSLSTSYLLRFAFCLVCIYYFLLFCMLSHRRNLFLYFCIYEFYVYILFCSHLNFTVPLLCVITWFAIYLNIFNFNVKEVFRFPSHCLTHPQSQLRQLTWHPHVVAGLLQIKLIIRLILVYVHHFHCLCPVNVLSINRPTTQ